MNMSTVLLKKINNRSATVGVIGLGYVGLPLIIQFVKAGYKAIGFDVDAETQLGNHYLQELEHFCHCVRTGETPAVTGEDGRRGVEIINATYLSHFRNCWVDLPLAHASELHTLFEQYRREQEAVRQGSSSGGKASE